MANTVTEPEGLRSGTKVGRGPMTELTAADAVYAAVLYWIVEDRSTVRERVTDHAAENIAAMAGIIGLHPTCDAQALGFSVREGVVHGIDRDVGLAVFSYVEDHNAVDLVHRLYTLCKGRSVAELEATSPGVRETQP